MKQSWNLLTRDANNSKGPIEGVNLDTKVGQHVIDNIYQLFMHFHSTGREKSFHFLRSFTGASFGAIVRTSCAPAWP